MKVQLKKRRDTEWMPDGWSVKSIIRSIPFYLSRQGKYVHRVRSADNHWRKGKLSHTAVHFWCGNSGFLGEKGRLLENVPDGMYLCARCEGMAIGANELDGGLINGRPVKYSPRR